MTDCDLIVCGLGGMGSAAFYNASQRGMSVIGIDPHPIGHSEGSSHGETRLIRQAYFEHPDYVPLLQRAYRLWDELDARLTQPVFHRSGLVIYGPPDALLADVKKSAKLYQIPTTICTSDGADADRFHIPTDWQGILEPNAGYLEVERAITEQVRLGCERGGQIRRFGLSDWHYEKGHVVVSLADGSSLRANSMVVALGAWSSSFLKIPLDLKVCRVPLYWFRPTKPLFTDRPCFAFDTPEGFFYGFQEGSGLVKVAPHIPGPQTDPNAVDRHRIATEDASIVAFVKQYIPGLECEIFDHKVCMYTMSPDEHFYIDQHPDAPHIAFAAGLSGHGFKFATVMGETLVDLATVGKTKNPVSFLRVGRHV